jgi:hypothetical protein
MARRPSLDLDWEGLFREWRGSGLTQPEFCRRRGIPLGNDRDDHVLEAVQDVEITVRILTADVSRTKEAVPERKSGFLRILPVELAASLRAYQKYTWPRTQNRSELRLKTPFASLTRTGEPYAACCHST